VIGESNVKVIGAGPVLKTLSPSMEGELRVPKKVESQNAVPLHETSRSGYLIEVAVFEIGELKSWSVWGPATAKYAALSVKVVTEALAGPSLIAISSEQIAKSDARITHVGMEARRAEAERRSWFGIGAPLNMWLAPHLDGKPDWFWAKAGAKISRQCAWLKERMSWPE
jgi:hypothetical protein